MVAEAAPAAVRAALERQLASVVGFLDDHELSDLLDVAVARFVSPAPAPTGPDDVAVHQVEASLIARQGWVLGIVVRHATPLATAWRWYTGTASGVALSAADAVARVAAKGGPAAVENG
jgi:hypothetical protein